MSEKFKNTYRIPTARLQDWDYGSNAAYFVTICTKDREPFFGEIADGQMYLSEIGQLAQKFWLEIPSHFPFTELDTFVVMPNHVHGILIVNKPEEYIPEAPVETRHCLVSPTIPDHEIPDKTIGQKRFQNQGKHTLSSIVGSYKSVVTKFARQLHADFAWQARFHDHVIRANKAHEEIANYIFNNPFNWQQDKFYTI